MKKFIFLFMFVFGINTAVNAQTKMIFTDYETKETKEFYFEKSLSDSEIEILKKESYRTSNAAQYPGRFNLYLGVHTGNGNWLIFEFDYGYPAGHTFADVINNILKMFF